MLSLVTSRLLDVPVSQEQETSFALQTKEATSKYL